MFIVCPNNTKHKLFYTTAHVMQEWAVNEVGDFNRVTVDCLEVTHTPTKGNIFTCAKCGAEAAVSEGYVDALEKADKKKKKK